MISWLANIKIPKAVIICAIDSIDVDKDGFISVKEIINALKLAVKRAKMSE